MRIVPALCVLGVLAGATLHSRGARATADSALAQDCGVPLQAQLAFDDSMGASDGVGIVQPFAASANVAACSLAVKLANPYYTFCGVELRQWDPVTLAPDPRTIALRSSFLDPSRVLWNGTSIRIDFDPPVVAQALPGVADPPRGSLAFSFVGHDFYGTHTTYFRRNGPAGMPAAQAQLPDGSLLPLPGTHPVAAHAFCGGAVSNLNRRVVQSVMTTDAVLDTSVEELEQRFRVPIGVDAEWVELAMRTGLTPQQYGLMSVAIEDAQGAPVPPPISGTPFASRDYDAYTYYLDPPHWLPAPSFDQPVHLLAGRDYWLHVSMRHSYWIYARTRHGDESADFNSGIGPLFARFTPGGSWWPRPDMNLSFRLIGTASTVTAVTPPPAPRTAFALRVSPNPASGAAFVEWHDAHGAVRIEVLDAHGRRVGGGEASGASGRWLWSAPRTGDARAAGVYFVRATDGEGRVAVERLVRVR